MKTVIKNTKNAWFKVVNNHLSRPQMVLLFFAIALTVTAILHGCGVQLDQR
jgi:hypothetical protein